jgi:hypothetical protein
MNTKTPRESNKDFAPMYTLIVPRLSKIANDHGYAMSIHGSMKTDLDLIITPWVEDAKPTDVLLNAFVKELGEEYCYLSKPEAKPHGRIAFIIQYGNGWLDISVPKYIEVPIMKEYIRVSGNILSNPILCECGSYIYDVIVTSDPECILSVGSIIKCCCNEMCTSFSVPHNVKNNIDCIEYNYPRVGINVKDT